jgi:hypothetical protein
MSPLVWHSFKRIDMDYVGPNKKLIKKRAWTELGIFPKDHEKRGIIHISLIDMN